MTETQLSSLCFFYRCKTGLVVLTGLGIEKLCQNGPRRAILPATLILAWSMVIHKFLEAGHEALEEENLMDMWHELDGVHDMAERVSFSCSELGLKELKLMSET